MDYLGRYYTEDSFSRLLIQNLAFEKPETVLDLGVGGGSLIRAAYDRWNGAKFIAADIDRVSISRLNKALPFIKAFQLDGLRVNIEKTMSLTKETVDVAVCNPPYLVVRDKVKFKTLFDEANLKDCINLNKVTSDIVFLAQNLKLLKTYGELGIILPDSILTGQEFLPLRKNIIENHKLKGIIELPDRIFSKTEAKTHIILLEKGNSTFNNVPLFIAGKDGVCKDQLNVSSNLLIERMDFSFHKVSVNYRKNNKTKKLSDYEYSLFRGTKTHAELKSNYKDFIHSTSFKQGEKLIFSGKARKKKGNIVATKGDIIFTRVGRGCVGKCALVIEGEVIVSDCLYVIKAKADVIKRVWSFITSSDGKKWIDANAHGVCARVLSKKDVANIPIAT